MAVYAQDPSASYEPSTYFMPPMPSNPYSDMNIPPVYFEYKGDQIPFDFAGLMESNWNQQMYAAQIANQFTLSNARMAMQYNAEQAKLNRDFQLSSARETNRFNAEQAAISRDWYERMSNTAVQRRMEDLKTAGINPILAYTDGGAATTSGATASGRSASGSSAAVNAMSGHMPNVDTSTVKDIITQAISSVGQLASSTVRGLFDLASKPTYNTYNTGDRYYGW